MDAHHSYRISVSDGGSYPGEGVGYSTRTGDLLLSVELIGEILKKERIGRLE